MGKETTPFPLQRIAQWGACGKTRVGAQNRRSIRHFAPQIRADDVNSLSTSAFNLPDTLTAKADPALIAADERHFAAIAESLEQTIADLADRLAAERRAPGGTGQEALDRDLEAPRLPPRLRALRRFGLDLCLGRVVHEGDGEPVYVGRLGLTDRTGR